MKELNITSRSTDWRAQMLSNFAPTPFELDGKRFVCVEAFIQGIKFPEDDPRREATFRMQGGEAKKMSREASCDFGQMMVWWNGKPIFWGSSEHHAIIERAIRAKFQQNREALEALLATRGFTLTHNLGRPESSKTSLPTKVFLRVLTSIREEHSRGK